MNICGNGICVCDNYEYPDSCCEQSQVYLNYVPPEFRVYYMDYEIWPGHAIQISIDSREEMRSGVQYFYDPDMTKPVKDV